MLFSPPILKHGDLVQILSTARVATIEDVADAVELLESWGLRVKLGSTIGRVCNQFAGTDEERAHDLQQALDCSETKAIFCARGGYGTNRILDRISFSGFMKHPKWVIGFSDVTFLHLHLNFMLGVRTIHSFMAALTKKTSQAAKEALRSILFGEKVSYHFNPHPFNKIGKATAMLCGGNLSILYASTGTQLVINSAGSVCFLKILTSIYITLTV
ncbi:MAG: LD-carboxypeptidase [Chitinophagales bacterium]|nr:LD-carboxypeptidase [Chitinophagales bacterium]